MKYLKDKKVQIIGMTVGGVDDEGVYQPGQVSVLGEFWAHVQGVKTEEYFMMGVQPENPRLIITLTRPPFTISMAHKVKYNGIYYNIEAIDLLEDKPHSDIKLSVECDRDQYE